MHDLSNCIQTNRLLVCRGVFSISRAPTCLSVVFRQLTDLIPNLCKLRSVPQVAQSWPLNERNFLLYHPVQETVSISCQTDVVDSRMFTGLRILHVPPHCTALSKNIRILPHFQTVQDRTVYRPPFRGLDFSHRHFADSPILNIESFNKSIPSIVHDPSVFNFTPISSIWDWVPHVLSGLAILAFCLLALMLFCRYRRVNQIM